MDEQRADPPRYFGDKDIEGMFATLGPLHDLLARVSCSLISRILSAAHYQ